MTQKERAKLKKKCDALWSKVTKIEWLKRFGDPICPWCCQRYGTQSDHIANRWMHATRWRVENAVILCMPCHIFRKPRQPAEWTEMVIETIGREQYEAVMSASKEVVKDQDYQKVYDYLKSFDITDDKPMGAKA
jgi:hypothetical protein